MLDNSPDKVSFRSLLPDDKNFIYATWLNSFYFGSRFAQKIPKSIYYEYHQQILDQIFGHPKTKILIACLEEDPDVIFGYLVYQEFKVPIVQYVYVKGAFQRYGIASELLRESGVDLGSCIFTHWTFDTNWIIDKYPTLTYIPYLMS